MNSSGWWRSARFRLALLYSVTVFALAGLAVAALYVAVRDDLTSRPPLEVSTSGEPGGRTRVEVRQYIGVDQAANAAALDALGRYSAAALAGLFVSSLGVGWLIAGRVLRPLHEITTVARTITSTDLSRRIAPDGPDDELRQLAETFDSMLDRLEEGSAAQARFIEDVSHDLRTPLAVMRTNLDVALEADDIDRLRRAATVSRRAVDRLARLVDELLAVARTRNEPPHEPVDLAALARDVTEEFSVAAASRHVHLELVDAPTHHVIGDRDALHRAAANVVANAIEHAPAGTAVTIATGRSDGHSWFRVTDNGPGVGRAERTQVFERNWRRDDSTRGSGGLGLAIVRQITEAHRGTIDIADAPAGGAQFTITLPSQPRPTTDAVERRTAGST